MQLRLGYAWGEECRYFGPSEYRDVVIAGAQSLLSNGVDVHVHIRTHPRFMDQWVDLLVSSIFLLSGLCISCSVSRRIGNFGFSFWLTSLRGNHEQRPDCRFVESGACGSGDSRTLSPINSYQMTFSSSSYTGDTQIASVYIKNFHNYFSTHVKLTNERPYRANSFKTSGPSRQFSSYIQSCSTDSLSSLSTASAKDIKCQG